MAQESVYFTLSQMVDKHTAKTIKKELSRMPGVTSVVVGAGKDTVNIDFDSTGTTAQRIEKTLCGMHLDIHMQQESAEGHT